MEIIRQENNAAEYFNYYTKKDNATAAERARFIALEEAREMSRVVKGDNARRFKKTFRNDSFVKFTNK